MLFTISSREDLIVKRRGFLDVLRKMFSSPENRRRRREKSKPKGLKYYNTGNLAKSMIYSLKMRDEK